MPRGVDAQRYLISGEVAPRFEGEGLETQPVVEPQARRVAAKARHPDFGAEAPSESDFDHRLDQVTPHAVAAQRGVDHDVAEGTGRFRWPAREVGEPTTAPSRVTTVASARPAMAVANCATVSG